MPSAKKAYVSDGVNWLPLVSGLPDIAGLATLAYVDSAINTASAAAVSYLVDSAPGTLDTLNELAAALGDDPNYATTITASLATKLNTSTASSTYLTQVSASTTYAPINSPTFTGQVTMTSPQINSNAQYNLGIGVEALNSVTTSGTSNIAIGDYSLSTVTSGDRNIAIGVNSQYAVTGGYNTSVGDNSLGSLVAGNENVAIGSNALVNLTANGGNTAVGQDALGFVKTGSLNTALGYYAGSTLDLNASKNTFLGQGAGEVFSSGNANVIIGSNNGSTISGTNNNIIISDGDGNIKTKYLSSDSTWTFTGIVSILEILDVAEVRETVVSNSFSTNVMTANYNDGAIHYATVAPTGNFTISLTNVPTTTSKSITMSFLITQGSTGYIPTTLNLNGSSQTIRWVGGSAPTPTSSAGKIDIFNFTLILAASNVVIASANLNI